MKILASEECLCRATSVGTRHLPRESSCNSYFSSIHIHPIRRIFLQSNRLPFYNPYPAPAPPLEKMLKCFVATTTNERSFPLTRWPIEITPTRWSAQLEDTLTEEGPPPGLTSLVKGLVKNYKLDESLRQGALYIDSQGDRNAAASAGREALEYLAQTIEYFPVELDERCASHGEGALSHRW